MKTQLVQEQSNQNIDSLTSVYSGNGNIIGVLPLSSWAFSSSDYRNDLNLRDNLAFWGQQHKVDSIMVLTGNPALNQKQGYHFFMDVFEPRGKDRSGMAGSWSSMCGNGLMAVSLFFENEFRELDNNDRIKIQTRSGLRLSTKVGNGRYSVCMGEFTYRANDLKKYINHHQPPEYEWFQIHMPDFIHLNFSEIWSIGLSGNRTKNNPMDGEPHVVMLRHPNGQRVDIAGLRDIAVRQGPFITKNTKFFPQEINANFAIVQKIDKNKREVSAIACTHERGLGDNPNHSVTDACGTGATAIAATLYRAYNLEEGFMVGIQMPGGLLQVYKNNNQFYLIGSAKKLKNNI